MNKLLRFSLITLLMMLCGSIYADDTTITGAQLADYGQEGGITVNGFTIIALKNDGGSAPTVNASAGDARLYAKNTLTIKSANGNLKKLVFNISTQGKKRLTSITADNGTISAQAVGDETVTWTGDAAEVTLTVGEKAVYGSDGDTKAGQFDFDNVVITVGEGGSVTPVDPDPDPSGETVTLDFDTDYATLFPTLPGVSHGASGDTPASSDGDFTTTTTSTAVDGVTITVEATESGTANRIWNASPRLRLYSKSITIKSEKSFNKIVFSPFATNNSLIAKSNVPSSGALEGPETQKGDVTWTGAAVKELTITIAGNTQIGKMVITLGEGGTDIVKVPVPTITGTAEFTDKTKVTITCADEDAAIYYTIDGSDPKTSSTVETYSEPFELTETATVKAYVEDVEGNTSDVVEKTFTKKEAPAGVEAATIAEFVALAANTENVTLTLNNAKVLGVGNKNIVVHDGTAGTDLYGLTDLNVKQGDILNGTVTGKRVDYNGISEMSNTTGNTITVTNGTISATKSTVAAAVDGPVFDGLIKLENVEVVLDGSRYYAKDGDKKIQIYDNFKLNYAVSAEGTYTLEGVVGAYKEKQLWLTAAPEATQPIEIEKAANIAALKALDKGKEAELTLTNAQVLYAWKSTNGNIQAYVRDASGAMCFDFRGANAAAGEKFETNKIVNGTIIISNSVYNNLPQASATAETNDSKLTFADGSEAVPVSATIATVPNYICDLVEIEIDEIVSDEAEKPKYYAKSGDDQIQIYNQFHVAAYEDLSTLVGPASKVKGIAVIYQKNATDEPIYEIYPVANGIVTGINEVNVNTVADGKIYNLAGQQVNSNFKGIVIKNGRKYIVK